MNSDHSILEVAKEHMEEDLQQVDQRISGSAENIKRGIHTEIGNRRKEKDRRALVPRGVTVGAQHARRSFLEKQTTPGFEARPRRICSAGVRSQEPAGRLQHTTCTRAQSTHSMQKHMMSMTRRMSTRSGEAGQ